MVGYAQAALAILSDDLTSSLNQTAGNQTVSPDGLL